MIAAEHKRRQNREAARKIPIDSTMDQVPNRTRPNLAGPFGRQSD
jgi:hypothetical protein